MLTLLAVGLLGTGGCMSTTLVRDKAMAHSEVDPETWQDRQVEGRPGYYALLPVTVAGDIATSPFQLLLLRARTRRKDTVVGQKHSGER